MAPTYLWLSFLLLAITTVVSSRNCFNPDTAQTCSGSGTCSVNTCQCYPGYEGQWCQTCKNCEKKCEEIRGCFECKLFDSGPAKHANQCGNCDKIVVRFQTSFLSVFLIEDIEQNQFDPRKSKVSKNGTCQIVDDSGCDLSFWYGYDNDKRLQVWSDKESRVCPPSEDKEVAEACSKQTTCTDCERSPGCGWCSNPDKDVKSRCSSIKENRKICPSPRIENKFMGGPIITKETREQRNQYDWVQLRPQGVELAMNVGDIKYLDFTYVFISSGTSFSHDFPENVELKIFSTCGGEFPLKEVKGCSGILNGNSAVFYARFRLKSCSTKSSDWKKSYKLTLSQGDVLDINMKMFCSCSCDKFTTDGICRNDKKTFLNINPCAEKNTCSECLRDSACNWCSGSKYSYFDGSPLPRCNNDNFFTSDLCSVDGKIDPPKALTGSEDCTDCKHTCSGGVCSENKRDLLDLNTCVSQLTCGDCMQANGCAWCPATDGAPRCNMVSNWIGRNEKRKNPRQIECQGNLYGDQSNVFKDKIDFFGNNGERLDVEDTNSEYYRETIPEMVDNTVDITMKAGKTYNLELRWNVKAAKYKISPDFWKMNPKYNTMKLNMKSKNKGNLSFLKFKYDYVCKGRTCNPNDILTDMDELIFNVSFELSDCPDGGLQDPIYIFLHREDTDRDRDRDRFPYGVVRMNVETLCACDCEKKCSVGYEKQHSSCGGGNLKCGVCQDCPDGSFGEFCQCTVDGSEKLPSPLKALPAVLIGKKDDLVGKSTKLFKDKISFDHVIVPIDVSPDTLKCNATYCMNTNSRECYTLGEKHSKFDLARAANMFAIYGDHRLIPGAELTFRITYCPLKLSHWGIHETRFGFGTPPSKNNDYTLPQKQSSKMLKFWSDDSISWEAEGVDRSDSSLQDVDYGHYAWYGNTRPSFSGRRPEGQGGYLGYVKQKIESDVKLVVTETAVIWSWEGFKSREQPNLTELTQTIDMKEKEYYPLFLLPGCETDGDFSSVEIISSKVGKA